MSSIKRLTSRRLKAIIAEEKEKLIQERNLEEDKEKRKLLEAFIMYKEALSMQEDNKRIIRVLEKYIKNKRRP